METCSNNHDEIVFEGKHYDCPLCAANEKIAELEEKISELENEKLNEKE
jgi:hypothetical protein